MFRTDKWGVYCSLYWCLELSLLKCKISCLHYISLLREFDKLIPVNQISEFSRFLISGLENPTLVGPWKLLTLWIFYNWHKGYFYTSQLLLTKNTDISNVTTLLNCMLTLRNSSIAKVSLMLGQYSKILQNLQSLSCCQMSDLALNIDCYVSYCKCQDTFSSALGMNSTGLTAWQ